MNKLHFIKDEMLIHIPVCTHAQPESILVVGGCNDIRHEIEKHACLKESTFIDADGAIDALEKLSGNRYDIAVVADDRFSDNRDFWIALTKLLDEKGVVSALSPDIYRDIESSKTNMKLLGSIYKIVMPYRYEEEREGGMVLSHMVLASRFYHPTADLNLQRADLTSGFRYYNSDIAISAFATPTFINREYLGIIKR
jgi:spermidine synthase